MRLFFAATLPDDMLDRILAEQTALRAVVGENGVRWTRREQFHFTIRFLGEHPEGRRLRAMTIAAAVAKDREPFDVELGGIGAFPNHERPSILWMGVKSGAESMLSLAADLDKVLLNASFQKEKRPIKAHLTLARVKGYAGEIAAVRALKSIKDVEIGTARIDRFLLMESRLLPTGSEYSVLEQYLFRN